MSTLIAILAMALPATPAEAAPRPCEPGHVMVGPRCRRHPLRHASHVRGCFTYRCDQRMTRKMQRRAQRRLLAHWRRVAAPYRGWLAQVRQCESGGNYRTATGNGFWGAYQFTLSSWRAVGGSGYPHLASPAEQDYRAVRLLHVQGRGAWPNCG
jgi:hypothetical protein